MGAMEIPRIIYSPLNNVFAIVLGLWREDFALPLGLYHVEPPPSKGRVLLSWPKQQRREPELH